MSLGYRLRDDAAPGDTGKGADRRARASIDGEEFVSCARSLKLDSSAGPVLAEKPIAMPDRAPFGISEGVFAIVEGAKIEEAAGDEEGPEAKERKTRKLANERAYVHRNLALLTELSRERTAVREVESKTHEAAGSSGEEGAKILSAVPPGSYYIYSFDGKLMAEYNGAGQLVRDYIYIGNQLVANTREARPTSITPPTRSTRRGPSRTAPVRSFIPWLMTLTAGSKRLGGRRPTRPR